MVGTAMGPALLQTLLAAAAIGPLPSAAGGADALARALAALAALAGAEAVGAWATQVLLGGEAEAAAAAAAEADVEADAAVSHPGPPAPVAAGGGMSVSEAMARSVVAELQGAARMQQQQQQHQQHQQTAGAELKIKKMLKSLSKCCGGRT